MPEAKKSSRARISESTIWLIAIGIVIVGVIGYIIWMQSIHH